MLINVDCKSVLFFILDTGSFITLLCPNLLLALDRKPMNEVRLDSITVLLNYFPDFVDNLRTSLRALGEVFSELSSSQLSNKS